MGLKNIPAVPFDLSDILTSGPKLLDRRQQIKIAKNELTNEYTIGDQGFVMRLSPRVPRIIADHLRPWIDDWCGLQGLDVSQIGSWAIHAGGPRIVDAVAERLGLSEDKVRQSRALLSRQGNVSSASVLFVLRNLRAESAPLPCVALGFGPGLVAEAALFR